MVLQQNLEAPYARPNSDPLSGKFLWILLILWLMINIASYLVLGFRVRGDGAAMYLPAARNLLAGGTLTDDQSVRIGYIIFTAFCLKLGGLTFVLFTQCTLSLIASLCLFNIGRNLFSPLAGLIAALLYGANPDIVRWNFYLQATSLQICLFPIAVWLAFKARQKLILWLPTCLLVFILTTIRPYSKVLTLPFFIYALLSTHRSYFWRTFLVGLFFEAFIILFMPKAPSAWGFMIEFIAKGVYIWPSEVISFFGQMPSGDFAPSWRGLMNLFLDYPFWVIQVLLWRWGAFYLHTRPFYSLKHNILAGAMSLSVFFFALSGSVYLFRQRKYRCEVVFFLMPLLIMTLIVGVWTADWDGRFFLEVIPPVFVLTGGGVAYYLDLFKRKIPTQI